MQTPCKYAAYASSTFLPLPDLRSVAKPMKFNLTAQKKKKRQQPNGATPSRGISRHLADKLNL